MAASDSGSEDADLSEWVAARPKAQVTSTGISWQKQEPEKSPPETEAERGADTDEGEGLFVSPWKEDRVPASSSVPTPQQDVQVIIPPIPELDLSEYQDISGPDRRAIEVLRSSGQGESQTFLVRLESGQSQTHTLDTLLNLNAGQVVYDAYKEILGINESDSEPPGTEVDMTSSRPASKRQVNDEFVGAEELDDYFDDSADDLDEPASRRSSRLQTNGSRVKLRQNSIQTRHYLRRSDKQGSFSSDDELSNRPRRSRRGVDEDLVMLDGSSSEEISMLVSDVGHRQSRRSLGKRKRPSYVSEDGTIFDKPPPSKSTRSSGRSTRHKGGMQEVGEDQIQRSDSESRTPAAPKIVNVKEVFKSLPRTDPFRTRHVQQCDTCNHDGNYAPLVYCQGCTLAYHKSCLGQRSSRDHLVTKVGPEDFVLQCRRCVRSAQNKDPSAPDHSKCQDCKAQGSSCKAFRVRKTPAQEQKDRETNGGEDPIFPVPSALINNPSNVLFRCVTCFRGFHFEHLPPLTDLVNLSGGSAAELRFAEYAKAWRCKDCLDAPAKIRGIVAWKPVDEDTYDPTKTVEQIHEDDKVYLIRWEDLSYFRAIWMPGAWVSGVAAPAMMKAFNRREEALTPKMRTEDAIPEEYLRADIVLDVAYTSIVDIDGEEIDKARIKEVKKALIKFKGLGYEDAVWEAPPLPDDEDRWTDFVKAYNEWVAGKYIHIPKSGPLQLRLQKARGLDFATKLEKKKQPDNLVGGELMKYQLDGLNWLYYKWYSQENAILADEMGLGKTIQIIGLLATLVSDWNCFPFLVVVPNATCANWRREIKQWAPALRAVAFFGSQTARDMAHRYELFPRQSKDPRCHIVITSYEAAAEPSNKRFFKSVQWQALIVDEGQRLKSDKTILYNALTDLKIPFRILLTGTPLQNNQRELFNLLQFLDDNYNAAQMEEEYAELDNEKVTKLHDMIRPFFLRRTKVQVLTFLPPMAQIILPVSLSFVQKKLYKSILAKNPELLRTLFKQRADLRPSERGNLNNILMQLRKCLCHPFVYSKSIEERNVSHSVSHRNLVEASGKLQLLELLLPKLKERGHRILIFSQFLDMLTMVEDFLDGLGLAYGRLDGSMSSLQKQKRIDKFNAADSELFAFLLSTRAGGVGINLATADTVIILDPDFNPHQDIQALSRAHRIGQKKKVLCFQLVTRASAEERIVQIGRRKIALDHILIEQMDAEDASEQDLQSILAYGAAELFGNDSEADIKYDSAAIDKLLDRSQIEDTKAGDDQSAESQFSFARVWAHSGLEDALPAAVEAEVQAPDQGLWDKILKEREKAAADEAAAAEATFGRGRRAKHVIHYGAKDAANIGADAADTADAQRIKYAGDDDDNDTDFQDDSDAESGNEAADLAEDDISDKELEGLVAKIHNQKPTDKAPTFRRVSVKNTLGYPGFPTPPGSGLDIAGRNDGGYGYMNETAFACSACLQYHAQGNCPLKKAGVEFCNLCGIAHYGHARNCPHISSETQVRAMLHALKRSPEAGHLVAEARKYLTGVKGTLVQKKKQEEERRRRRMDETSDLGNKPAFAPRPQHPVPVVASIEQTYVTASNPTHPGAHGGMPMTATNGSGQPVMGTQYSEHHHQHYQPHNDGQYRQEQHNHVQNQQEQHNHTQYQQEPHFHYPQLQGRNEEPYYQ